MRTKKAEPGGDKKRGSAPLQLHLRLLVEQRDYIKRLSTNRSINESGDIGELFSRGLVLFLSAAPYEEKNWTWLKPESTYVWIAGERVQNHGWCAAHYILWDIEEQGSLCTAQGIASKVKRLSVSQSQQEVLFSAVNWMTTVLYPRHIFDIKHLPSRFQVDPARVQALAKEMAELTLTQ